MILIDPLYIIAISGIGFIVGMVVGYELKERNP